MHTLELFIQGESMQKYSKNSPHKLNLFGDK
jgi:hypothetical protein